MEHNQPGSVSSANRTQTSEEYEANMIQAFIDNPEKGIWYQNAFSRYSILGIDKLAWNWSWWAFFGGVFYLLYRKAYLPALGLFALNFVAGAVPFGALILWIFSGGYAPYFIYKTYKAKKLEIESTIEDPEKQIEVMHELGGSHSWVIWVAGFFYFLAAISVTIGAFSGLGSH